MITAHRTIELWLDAAATAMDAGERPARRWLCTPARDQRRLPACCWTRPRGRADRARSPAAGALDRARRDLELFLLQHRLDPMLARAGEAALAVEAAAMTPMTAADFERRYRADPDPWGYTSSDYEREKYAATLDGLRPRAVRCALELGGSIGVFSAMLAPRCRRLVTIDVAPRPCALARERLGRDPRVDVHLGDDAGRDLPPGPFDLVVASEILYYLEPGRAAATLDRAGRADGAGRAAGRGALAPGRARAAVHADGGPRAPARPSRGSSLRPRRGPTSTCSTSWADDERARRAAGDRRRAGRASPRPAPTATADGAGPVAIVTDERRMPYSRPPLTKELLRGEIAEAELLLEEESWLTEHEVDLIARPGGEHRPGRRTVSLSGGRELEYGSCVLATGAEPTRLPVPGADDPAVRVLRSLDDLRELSARLEPGSRSWCIGSGFIGCEIAASLRTRGHPVTLVSDEPAPNVGRLGERRRGRRSRGWLEEDGVELPSRRCGRGDRARRRTR